MAKKKILVTVETLDTKIQQDLEPSHADRLMQQSKLFRVVNDPREKIDPPKEKRVKEEKKD